MPFNREGGGGREGGRGEGGGGEGGRGWERGGEGGRGREREREKRCLCSYEAFALDFGPSQPCSQFEQQRISSKGVVQLDLGTARSKHTPHLHHEAE